MGEFTSSSLWVTVIIRGESAALLGTIQNEKLLLTLKSKVWCVFVSLHIFLKTQRTHWSACQSWSFHTWSAKGLPTHLYHNPLEYLMESTVPGPGSGMCSNWVPKGIGNCCAWLKLGPWLLHSASGEYEACLDMCPLPDVVVSVREVAFLRWITISAPEGCPSKAGNAISVLIVSLNWAIWFCLK